MDKNNTKFCKHCGETIDVEAVVCIKCGKQVEELQFSSAPSQPQITINNVNENQNINTNTIGVNSAMGRPKNKWVALGLCVFLGWLGAHKFYENKGGVGVLYALTFGLFFIGIFFDFFSILSKPNIYYVR